VDPVLRIIDPTERRKEIDREIDIERYIYREREKDREKLFGSNLPSNFCPGEA